MMFIQTKIAFHMVQKKASVTLTEAVNIITH